MKKEKFPKITKELLEYLDEVEKGREITFQSLDVFGYTYTESSVKGKLEEDLMDIPLLVNKFKYISDAKSHIDKMNDNSHIKAELSYGELSLEDNQRLNMVYAHSPIKVWIKKKYIEIEKELKKEESKQEKMRGLKDALTTFQIKDKYIHLLQNMWGLMKDPKNSLINSKTLFEDFKVIFENNKKEEINKPIVWIGNKITLLKLFYTLSDKRIIHYKVLSYDKDNILDICFIDYNTKLPYKEWRKTHSKMLTSNRINEQKKIDMILNLFN